MKEGDQDFTVMRIIMKGQEDGENVSYRYDLLDRYEENTISMARTTGFTCTAVANLVLDKKYTKIGISPPEFLGENFEEIRDYLKQRNVNYKITKS
jgi:YD repeat-containing protein